jgi:hypothetical protein
MMAAVVVVEQRKGGSDVRSTLERRSVFGDGRTVWAGIEEGSGPAPGRRQLSTYRYCAVLCC